MLHTTLKFCKFGFNAPNKKESCFQLIWGSVYFKQSRCGLGYARPLIVQQPPRELRLCQATNKVRPDFSPRHVFFGSKFLASHKGFDFLFVCSHRAKKRSSRGGFKVGEDCHTRWNKNHFLTFEESRWTGGMSPNIWFKCLDKSLLGTMDADAIRCSNV